MFGIPKFLQEKLIKKAAAHLREAGHKYLIVQVNEQDEIEILTPDKMAIIPKEEHDFLLSVYQNSLTIKNQ